MNRTFARVGAASGFLGVALGAFGAHGLKGYLTPEMMAVFQTGVQYQLIHSLVLLVVGLMSQGGKWVSRAGYLFSAGVVLFSGSLYALALTGISKLGAITPLGGVCLLGGWIALFLSIGSDKG